MNRFISSTKLSIERALESARRNDEAAASLEAQAAGYRAEAANNRAAAAEAQFVLDNLSKITADAPPAA